MTKSFADHVEKPDRNSPPTDEKAPVSTRSAELDEDFSDEERQHLVSTTQSSKLGTAAEFDLTSGTKASAKIRPQVDSMAMPTILGFFPRSD